MSMTKKVNVFNQAEREIRCVAKEHDYLGNGHLTVEDELAVGSIYPFIHGRAECYGNMVFLKEHPSRWGYQAYLFEELKPYDELTYIQKSKEWLLSKIDVGINSTRTAKSYSAEELDREMEELLRFEPFDPHFAEGHDAGAAYWIYPVTVRDTARIEDADILEYRDYEISIPDRYFDNLLTDFFTDGIDPELSINAHRYSTDDVPEGVPIFGFEWYLHPNFYTYEQMKRIMNRIGDTAELLRKGHINLLPSKLKSRLRKEFAAVDEDESATRYRDAMMITADYYEKLIARIQQMMAACKQTDILCVMGP